MHGAHRATLPAEPSNRQRQQRALELTALVARLTHALKQLDAPASWPL
jgi:hypothetical protein